MTILKKTYGCCIFKGPNQHAVEAACSQMYHLESDSTQATISDE